MIMSHDSLHGCILGWLQESLSKYTGASALLEKLTEKDWFWTNKPTVNGFIPWETNIIVVNRDTQETTYSWGFIWMCSGHLRVKFLCPHMHVLLSASLPRSWHQETRAWPPSYKHIEGTLIWSNWPESIQMLDVYIVSFIIGLHLSNMGKIMVYYVSFMIFYW